MKAIIIVLALTLFLTGTSYGEDIPANEYFEPEKMGKVRQSIHNQSGNSTNYLIMVDRLEAQFDQHNSTFLWDIQAWVGKDLNRLWLKTEGESLSEGEADEDGESELQLLYSKAISPYWDLQLGWRHTFNRHKDRDFVVVGLQGLAPQWFELDIAAFVSDKGHLSTKIEAEYDLLLTQKLILQPRAELKYSFTEDIENKLAQGLNKVEIGFRLRYEIRRNLAPYLGVIWSRTYAEGINAFRFEGQDIEETSLVAGFRLWY